MRNKGAASLLASCVIVSSCAAPPRDSSIVGSTRGAELEIPVLSFFAESLRRRPYETCQVSEKDMVASPLSSDEVFRDYSNPPDRDALVSFFKSASFDEVIKRVRTPREASIYCSEYLSHGGEGIEEKNSGQDEYWFSGARTHRLRNVDCDDSALAAAALLADNGFKPYIAVIEGVVFRPDENMASPYRYMGHAVFVYKTSDGLYGTIGITKSDDNPPSNRDLKSVLAQTCFSSHDVLTSYRILDIGKAFPDFSSNYLNNSPFH